MKWKRKVNMGDWNWTKIWVAALLCALRSSHWFIAVSSIVVFVIALNFFQSSPPDFTWLSLDKTNLLAVAGSILASAVFFILVEFTLILKRTQTRAEKNWWRPIYQESGLRDIFEERGSNNARLKYKAFLKAAKFRVWAIGNTNSRFFNQHAKTIARLLRDRKNIDIRIAVADPNALISIPKLQNKQMSIVAVQNELEGGISSATDWSLQLETTIASFKRNLPVKQMGELKLFKLVSPSLFSCFIIDNNVFFFPMLTSLDSGHDPIIWCSVEGKLGQSILEHYQKVLHNSSNFCELIK